MNKKVNRVGSRLLSIVIAVMLLVTTLTATAATLKVETTGAGTHTIYYCYKGTVPSGYTVKANACQSNNDNKWDTQTMTDTGKTYQGYKIYTATVTDIYGGFDQLQFQQYEGSNWKSQEVAISSWATSDKFSGKMYYDGKWMAYTTDGGDTPTTQPTQATTQGSTDSHTHTIYYCLKGTLSAGYTLKANACQSNNDNKWDTQTMTDTGKTYQGYKIYTATVTDIHGGFDQLQFQQYEGTNWKSQEVAISSWATSDKFSGKMYYDGKWMDYTTDGGDTPTTQSTTQATQPTTQGSTDSHTHTIYYCLKGTLSAGYTLKANACQSNNDNKWVQTDMTDTGKTYQGYKIYTATVTDIHGGFDQMQFQQYEGTNWKSQEVAISSWTTSDKFSGKMYYDGKWMDYTTDDPQPSTGATTPTNPTDPIDVNPVKAGAFTNAIWVDTQPEKTDSTLGLVKFHKASSAYKLYLNAAADTSNMKVYFNGYSTVKIGSTTVVNGGTYNVASWNNQTLTLGSSAMPVKVFQSTARSMFINTSKDMDMSIHSGVDAAGAKVIKEGAVYKNAQYLALNEDGTVINKDNELMAQIKGRGNSSWEASCSRFGKYAYNIKLDSKVNLGSKNATKSKKWSFLANNADESMMRNIVVYNLSDSIGLEDSPLSEVYDLYDNGNYLGSYQITEKVEVGGSALVNGKNVEDLNEDFNAPADPTQDNPVDNYTRAYKNGSSINENSKAGFYKYCDGFATPDNFKTGDFLLEFELDERFPDEISGFISNKGQQIVLKSPEVASKDEVVYIMDRFNAAEAVIYAQSSGEGNGTHTYASGTLTISNGKYTYKSTVSNYTVTVGGYDELVDGESFAQNYLIQEYVENLDGVATSFYVNLSNEESIFTATPVWDFDWTMGQYGNGKKVNNNSTLYPSNTNQWFIKNKAIYNNYGTDNIVAKLCKINDFWSRVQVQWKYNVYPEIQNLLGSSGKIKGEYSDKLRKSVEMNEDRYHFIANDPIKDWGSADTGATWSAAVNSLESWANSRATWINNNIGTAKTLNKANNAGVDVAISQNDDGSLQAVATPTGITSSSALNANEFTYVFTINDGTSDTVVTQKGNNTVDVKDAVSVGEVYTVTALAYPTVAGKDTGFVVDGTDSYTVTNPSDPKLTIDKKTLALNIGETGTITAKATNVQGEVAWTTSNADVATVDGGVVTAVSAGTATITASVGELTATCEVTVTEVVSNDITVYFTNNKNWSTVYVYVWNDTTKEKIAEWPGTKADKVAKNEYEQDIYAFTFDASKYDSMIFNGGKDQPQTADITGITVADNNKGYYINSDAKDSDGKYTDIKSYNVIANPSVVLTETSTKLMIGDTYEIAPKSSVGHLTYTSSNDKVASVSDKGVVTAVAKGTVTITVTAKGTFDSKTATLEVTVDDEEKFTVTFKDYDGTVISAKEYVAGATVVVPDNPTREADEQYTYEFGGWTPEVSATVSADATYTAVYTTAPKRYTVAVNAENGKVTGCPTGAVEYGTSVTLKATANNGYTFKGFYNGDNRVTTNATYTFKVTGNVTLTAKFEALPGAELSIQVVGGSGMTLKIGADGTESKQSVNYRNRNVQTGQYITIKPTAIPGYTFQNWQNGNGKVIANSETYTFLFTGNTDLVAMYTNESDGMVTFISGYNQTNSSMCYASVDEIEIPTPYTKANYDFKFWSIDGTTEATAEDIFNASRDGNITVKAVYEVKDIKYTLTIENGSIVSVDNDTTDFGNTTGEYNSIKNIAVTANDAPQGKKFAYWTNQDGKIISYSQTFAIYLNGDTTITPVYVDENEVVDIKATADIASLTYDETTNKMQIVTSFSVPENCVILTAGVLGTTDASVGSNDSSFITTNTAVTNMTKKNLESNNYRNYRFTATKSKVAYGDTWFLRAYVQYKDENGNIQEVYGDIMTNESLFK